MSGSKNKPLPIRINCRGCAASPGKGLAGLAGKTAPYLPHTHPAAPKPPTSTSGRACTMLKGVSEREKGH